MKINHLDLVWWKWFLIVIPSGFGENTCNSSKLRYLANFAREESIMHMHASWRQFSHEPVPVWQYLKPDKPMPS
jgi:hypothetical protein